jgi:DnaB-like helicase N terminal domain/AAA domain
VNHRDSKDLNIEKSLPYSEAAEKGVLCSLILEPRLASEIRSQVRTDYFYNPAYKGLYEALLKLLDSGKAVRTSSIDFGLLSSFLRDAGQLDEIGGADGLNTIFQLLDTAANWRYYVEDVQEKWARREAILNCRRREKAAFDLGAKSDQWDPDASYGSNGKSPHSSGKTLPDFLDIEIDPLTNLAGNRWLTRDGSGFVIAPSGHGKSSLANQLAICWSIGKIAFGIKPARPLRILIVQSEDDDAETKKFVQMIRKMGLTEQQLQMLRTNTRFEFQRSLSGDKFIEALDGWLTEWPADITIINPLSGFLLCDLKDDEKVNLFLRDKLSSVMTKHHCAPLVFHHTPKTNFTKLDNMQWYDWMYAMSGCAGLTNWGRAVLVIAPSKLPGTYRFIAAKRFDEIQWTDREYWYSHSTEKITLDGQESILVQWVPSTEEQIRSAEPEKKVSKFKKTTPEMVLEKMSPVEWVTRPQFKDWAKEKFGLARDPADEMLTDLADRELVELDVTPRPHTNPLKRYRKSVK